MVEAAVECKRRVSRLGNTMHSARWGIILKAEGLSESLHMEGRDAPPNLLLSGFSSNLDSRTLS